MMLTLDKLLQCVCSWPPGTVWKWRRELSLVSRSFYFTYMHVHVLPHSNFMTCDVCTTSTHAVPGRNITVQDEMVSGTRFTVTVNLPITEYQPDQLLVIVSLSPNDNPPVVSNFPDSYQYTVRFAILMVDTRYNYSVWILRSDMTDVDHFEGSFAIAALRKLPSGQSNIHAMNRIPK